MRIATLVILIAQMVLCSTVFAELTAITVRDSDKTYIRIIYNEGKETARQVRDKDGNVTKTTGVIPDGLVREYDENGKLIFEWNYKNGVLEGTSRAYDMTGQLSREMNYKNNKLDGVSKNFFKSGKVFAEQHYREDKLEGVTRMYYESGDIIFEYFYKDGNLDGPGRLYYENGTLRGEELWKDGKKIRVKMYDEEGKEVLDRNFSGEESITPTKPLELDKGTIPGK